MNVSDKIIWLSVEEFEPGWTPTVYTITYKYDANNFIFNEAYHVKRTQTTHWFSIANFLDRVTT